jgi:hypothetical protein
VPGLDFSHQHSAGDIMQVDAPHTPITGESLILSSIVTLTDEQIKALPSTQVTVIPAQGANMLILPVVMLLHFVGPADYTNITPGSALKLDLSGAFVTPLRENTLSGISALLAGGGGSDGTLVALSLNTLASSTVTPVAPTAHFHQPAADSGFYDSDLVNKLLRIYIENNSGDLTGGDPANTLTIFTYYILVDLS